MTPEAQGRRPAVANHWLLVLFLVGLDYFSTLAYLPSLAVSAAGNLAPLAALAVVLVTVCLALPAYAYVVGRSPGGRGAAGLLEQVLPGWGGKLLVLTLLGFAAADFVITRSLSLADAATHVTHNSHGQAVLARMRPIAECSPCTTLFERALARDILQLVAGIRFRDLGSRSVDSPSKSTLEETRRSLTGEKSRRLLTRARISRRTKLTRSELTGARARMDFPVKRN